MGKWQRTAIFYAYPEWLRTLAVALAQFNPVRDGAGRAAGRAASWLCSACGQWRTSRPLEPVKRRQVDEVQRKTTCVKSEATENWLHQRQELGLARLGRSSHEIRRGSRRPSPVRVRLTGAATLPQASSARPPGFGVDPGV